MDPLETACIAVPFMECRYAAIGTVEVTEKALKDARDGKNLERFDSKEALFKSWDA